MGPFTKPLSSAAWILAHAAGRNHTTATTIAFGPTVTLLAPPRTRPSDVCDIAVAGGTDTFTDAVKLADELLHLRRPGTSRLLVVVSDGYLTDRDAAQQLLTTLHHAGGATLWLTPDPDAPTYQHTTRVAVTNPADAISHIADAACAAIAAATARHT
jgi:hypothetical protein